MASVALTRYVSIPTDNDVIQTLYALVLFGWLQPPLLSFSRLVHARACVPRCHRKSALFILCAFPTNLYQHTFPDLSRIVMNTTYYDGNATEYDWTLDKGTIINTNSSGGELALLLTETNGGTRLSSTRYLHYGTVTARSTSRSYLPVHRRTSELIRCVVKTGRWGGVVTAFITMSDIKDEIDWEFPGNATTQGQTNYFWQGVIRKCSVIRPSASPNHSGHTAQATHGTTVDGVSDTFQNYHDYTVSRYLQHSRSFFAYAGRFIDRLAARRPHMAH